MIGIVERVKFENFLFNHLESPVQSRSSGKQPPTIKVKVINVIKIVFSNSICFLERTSEKFVNSLTDIGAEFVNAKAPNKRCSDCHASLVVMLSLSPFFCSLLVVSFFVECPSLVTMDAAT